MNDGNSLLRAILARPADDTAKLAYADWLDENGQDERAEFIRIGFEIDRLRQITDSTQEYNNLLQREFELLCRVDKHLWVNWTRWCWAEARAEEGHPTRRDLSGGMSVYPAHHSLRDGKLVNVEVPTMDGQVKQYFKYGFVHAIELNMNTFLSSCRWCFGQIPPFSCGFCGGPDVINRRAKSLFSSQPIQGVIIRGIKPLLIENTYSLNLATRTVLGQIPHSIWNEMDGFEQAANSSTRTFATHQNAMDSLSRACVRFGRKVAGLPNE